MECGLEEEQNFLNNRKRLGGCDLVIFAYDSSDPNSFAHVAKLRVIRVSNLKQLFSIYHLALRKHT